MSKLKKPIAIYYEHPHWFVPLFKELERRGVPFVRIDAAQHHFDPAHLNGEGGYSLVFNRMSPSAYRSGPGQAIFYPLCSLDHLEQLEDIDDTAAAGFVFYTLDPKAEVDPEAEHADAPAIQRKVEVGASRPGYR